MSKLPVIKARELIRVLEQMGFWKHAQVGSHAQFKNASGKRVTVPVHAGKDITKKTLRGIIDDLELSVDDFVALLRKR